MIDLPNESCDNMADCLGGINSIVDVTARDAQRLCEMMRLTYEYAGKSLLVDLVFLYALRYKGGDLYDSFLKKEDAEGIANWIIRMGNNRYARSHMLGFLRFAHTWYGYGVGRLGSSPTPSPFLKAFGGPTPEYSDNLLFLIGYDVSLIVRAFMYLKV